MASRSSSSRAAALLAALLVALAVGASNAAAAPPWKAASEVHRQLAEAEKALIVERPGEARAHVAGAAPHAAALARLLRPHAPTASRSIAQSLADARLAARRRDAVRMGAARAALDTAVLGGAYRAAARSVRRGAVSEAKSWLLVREYRPPTRFSRPGADATLALAQLADRRVSRAAALSAVRADLLDTYQARLTGALAAADEALENEFPARVSAEAALARGYFAILRPAYATQRGAPAAGRLEMAFERLARAALRGDRTGYRAARARTGRALAGFRAAPLSEEEELRRAGQLLRFLALVPIEYGRGVADGRVTLAFEIQEAVTFRDGAALAFEDLESALAARDPRATRLIEAKLAVLDDALDAAARGGAVASEETVETQTGEALDLAESVFPEEWRDAGSSADFDVIRTALNRVEGAVGAGEYGRAEQARLEAYAFFEFGPEQRLRGLAPELFVRTEGLFWYGDGEHAGLAQLIRRKAGSEELGETRRALDRALADSEGAVGAGPTSRVAVITNTAVIVFREGLEAVLILAALTAGLTGARRRLRRPLFLGALCALAASMVTFFLAGSLLSSFVRYGEKLEAVVSFVAIGVLLLILNWFFHRVYWSDHLAELHGRKKRILNGAGLSVVTAQLVGLATLGFSAVYREGFETVLFLQALVLDAGAASVLEGVALGGAAVAGVGVLTIVLQRKLPHKRMLELTGLLILAVLFVMVGKTVQACQVVGWVAVHPIPDLQMPYWAGLWFGVFPTWEGLVAQAAAVVFVLGSYVLAERLRRRRRAPLLHHPVPRQPHGGPRAPAAHARAGAAESSAR